jgi:hypothetical protein
MMNILTLRLSLGAAALLFASGAPAQVDPASERAPQSHAKVNKAMINAKSVTVQDRDGDILNIAYGEGPPAHRQIEFRDAEGRLINIIPIGSPAPPRPAGGGQNPFFGDSIPPLPDTSPVSLRETRSGGALDDGKSDINSDTRNLVNRVNDLTRQVKILTDRINAAAAKR